MSEDEEDEDDSECLNNDDTGLIRESRYTRPTSEVCDGGETCLCLKSANEHSHHNAVITKKGYDLFVKWTLELEHRDQDVHGEYQGNDYNGYGAVEVVENIVCLHLDRLRT